MISIDEHVQSAIQLTNSLVIKMLDNALAINKGLILTKGMSIPSDRREWKYFMNLAGEKHSTNKEVEVTVIELTEKRPLTRELLDNYDYTKQELLKTGSLYEEVLTSYPDEYLYIQGCMYPVDKEEAIMARDGTILNYNKGLVEASEYSLIRDLQKYIYNFLQRWHVKAYTLVDELYLPYIMAILYASLPNKIINLRLNNINTTQVHSFHLEHHFRSNISIWEEIQFLKPKTIYWMYKNLNYLANNIGKEEVLQTVIDKVLTDNEIGIGAYFLRTPNVTINPDALREETRFETFRAAETKAITSDATHPVFKIPELVTTVEAANPLYVNSSDKSISIADIVTREISIGNNDRLKENADRIEQIKIDAAKHVEGNSVDYQRTKMMELSTYELFKRQGVDLFKVIFDYWAYLDSINLLNFVVEYTEPNDKRNYVTSPKVGLLLLIKSILTQTGMKDLRLKEIKYDIVMPQDPSVLNSVIPALYDDGNINAVIAKMKDGYPNLTQQITTVPSFTERLNAIINWYTYIWTLDANLESPTASANVKRILALTTQKGSIVLSDKPDGETIDELIQKENIIYVSNENYDFRSSMEAIIESYTGLSIDEYKFIKEISDSFKAILERLVSYTTQIMNTSSTEDSIFTQYNNIRLYRPKKGIIDLRKITFVPLEKFSGSLDTMANDFKEYGTTIHRNTINVEAKTFEDKPILKHFLGVDDIDLVFDAPIIRVKSSVVEEAI